SGVYSAAQLLVQVVGDENWEGGSGSFASRLHTQETYRDKQGRVVLSREFNLQGSTPEILSTYYVYDDLGRLSFVLPAGMNPDRTGTTAPTVSEIEQWGYTYRYDQRNRLVEQRLAGQAWQ